MIILETPRLLLRELTTDDAPNLYHLNLDPDVIRYTGDPPFESVEAAFDFLTHYDHYRKYGFGRWAVLRKPDNSFLGWCGLKYTPEWKEYDIGFRFLKAYWNLGFATEAAKACLELGFQKFDMPEIAGHAHRENAASIRVLKKIGLVEIGETDFDGKPVVLFKIENPRRGLTTAT